MSFKPYDIVKVAAQAFVLMLASSTFAHGSPSILACDLVGTDGSKWHLDYFVNFEEKTVNQQPALFTETSIFFERKLASGSIGKYMISRISGALTVTVDAEVLVNGNCSLSQGRKF